MSDYMVSETSGPVAIRYRPIVVWIHWISAALLLFQVLAARDDDIVIVAAARFTGVAAALHAFDASVGDAGRDEADRADRVTGGLARWVTVGSFSHFRSGCPEMSCFVQFCPVARLWVGSF